MDTKSRPLTSLSGYMTIIVKTILHSLQRLGAQKALLTKLLTQMRMLKSNPNACNPCFIGFYTCVGAWNRNTTGMQRMPGAPQFHSSTCNHSIFRIITLEC